MSPHFSPLLKRKGGVDQSTASFTEPMRPSTSHGSFLATRGKEASEEEDSDQSDDEVGCVHNGMSSTLPP